MESIISNCIISGDYISLNKMMKEGYPLFKFSRIITKLDNVDGVKFLMKNNYHEDIFKNAMYFRATKVIQYLISQKYQIDGQMLYQYSRNKEDITYLVSIISIDDMMANLDLSNM